MKKHHFYGGLFVPLLLIPTSCSYLTNNITNTPPLEQVKHAQAQLLAIHTIPNEKYKRKISGLLGLLQLWNNHRPDRNIIRLGDWRG